MIHASSIDSKTKNTTGNLYLPMFDCSHIKYREDVIFNAFLWITINISPNLYNVCRVIIVVIYWSIIKVTNFSNFLSATNLALLGWRKGGRCHIYSIFKESSISFAKQKCFSGKSKTSIVYITQPTYIYKFWLKLN